MAKPKRKGEDNSLLSSATSAQASGINESATEHSSLTLFARQDPKILSDKEKGKIRQSLERARTSALAGVIGIPFSLGGVALLLWPFIRTVNKFAYNKQVSEAFYLSVPNSTWTDCVDTSSPESAREQLSHRLGLQCDDELPGEGLTYFGGPPETDTTNPEIFGNQDANCTRAIDEQCGAFNAAQSNLQEFGLGSEAALFLGGAGALLFAVALLVSLFYAAKLLRPYSKMVSKSKQQDLERAISASTGVSSVNIRNWREKNVLQLLGHFAPVRSIASSPSQVENAGMVDDADQRSAIGLQNTL